MAELLLELMAQMRSQNCRFQKQEHIVEGILPRINPRLVVLMLAVSSARLLAQSYDFSTIAGLPGALGNFADGTNSVARFDSPTSIAVDTGGNLYVADYHNFIIRRITPSGTNWVVKTIAGMAGSFGSADGTNNNARFNQPTGIALDSNTNIYVADYFNHTIRKVTPSGTNWVVKTIAGMAGSFGSADGTNSDARFYFPRGVAVDAAGNVFVADLDNSTIRKITPVGTNWVVTTIAGMAGTNGIADGTNSNARFYWPAGIAVDASSNLFVSDYNNNTIRKLRPSGTNWVVSTIAGLAGTNGSANGTNSDARFYLPVGVAAGADGNLYVADFGNDQLRKLAPVGTNWVVSAFGGQAGIPGSTNGTNTVALFNQPQGIAVDNAGNIYVADAGNNAIRRGKILASSAAPPPSFQTILQSNGMVLFTWSAVTGRSYQVQFKTNLLQTNWINFGGILVATNISMTASDFTGPDRRRFYRVALLP
jgi:streptogramin lyase